MKMMIKPMLLIMMYMSFLMSCNNEDVFVDEPIAEAVDDEPEPEEETANEDTDVDASEPCDFDLSTIASGDTVVIDCTMDLGGATVNLPADVTILYEGGDIISGTLNFSDNTTISGELLNSSLETTGSSPILKDPVFEFVPERWGIVEGVVDDEVARNNRDILEAIMQKAKDIGAETFLIDEMDAYFNVVETGSNLRPSQAAINTPSDFHLLMTDNTHIRMQPNNYKQPSLIGFYRVDNVIMEGGNLYGDRDEHDYSDGGTHEWGHTIRFTGSTNITIKGVHSVNATGDGISIGSYGHAYDSYYQPSSNVLITNNIIEKNRRNGISIGDGRDIIIENNQFIDNGVDTELSKGTQPRMGIDIEPQNSNGIVYQIAKNITIRNNTETGAYGTTFYVADGYDITIDNNDTQGSIGYYHAYNLVISNNTITATSETQKESSRGIIGGAGTTVVDHTNYNNKIFGNKVIGYSLGLDVLNKEIEIYDNEFIDCKTGIALNELHDSKIYDNIITSDRDKSSGIVNKITAKSLNNVVISGNSIDVVLNAFGFNGINEENEDYSFEIINNTVKSGGTSGLNNLNNLLFDNNIVNGGIRLVGAKKSTISNNTITTDGAIGIDLSSENENLEVFGNTITINGSADCIRDKELNTDLSITDNTCN